MQPLEPSISFVIRLRILVLSSNALFSFSANSGENEQGDVMTHEISHSIGRLGDEYDKKMQGENISDTSDPDKIKWHKMLGFRGIGITAAGTETVFARAASA